MSIKTVLSFLTAACLMVASQVSLASGGSVTPVTNKLYVDECGSCHFAYQPAFLPASSWRKVMETLDDHFGENAELPNEDRDALTEYLVKNAGTGSGRGDIAKFIRSIRSGDVPLRISELPYFQKEHRKIPQRIVESEQVGSLSKCETCHRRAAEGSYREREINIPGYGRWDD
ncbi:diheme cytochrome c [Pseudomonadota bacterium]